MKKLLVAVATIAGAYFSAALYAEYAKANPGELTFATGNTAGIVALEMIKYRTGISMLHVPYKSTPLALEDVVAGRVSMMLADFTTAMPHINLPPAFGQYVASSQACSRDFVQFCAPNQPDGSRLAECIATHFLDFTEPCKAALAKSAASYAASQQNVAKLKADAQNVVGIIGGDKIKTHAYCQLIELGRRLEWADQEKDGKKAKALIQKIDHQLPKKIGPEFVALMNALKNVDLDSPDVLEIASIIESLDQSCD